MITHFLRVGVRDEADIDGIAGDDDARNVGLRAKDDLEQIAIPIGQVNVVATVIEARRIGLRIDRREMHT